MDFSRLGRNRRQILINPRDVFNALPAKPWASLRLEQGEVLAGWFERRTARDVVIKQNTGGGKTAAGLLIAQASLNEGVGPAVYLAPDTYLTAQAAAEAARLGIPVTDDPRDETFIAGGSILVTTFQRLINGRSVFGVVGSGRPTQRLGTIIVDDAHAALTLAPRQFRVAIPRDEEAYEQLRALFADALRAQSPSAWAAIDAQDAAAPVRVPFWTWRDQQDNVRRILRPLADDSSKPWIYFSWPLVEQVLDVSVATINDREFEIRPPCSPIDLIPAFAQAQRRIYLSATLADDGVLVTEFKADPDEVRRPVTPARAADLGDRLVLAPLSLNRQLDESAVRQLAQEFSLGRRSGGPEVTREPINVIVLVPSDRRAELWRGFADLVCHVNDLASVVARLKRGEHIGVVVLVNKYDGVDLPGDACRLLVIDGIPTPLDPGEAREAAGLHGTETFMERQVQRIEQGMGRGIRDAEDHCAVLLLGSELAVTVADPRRREIFSPATRAQIEVSTEVADQIRGEGLPALRELLDQFLERNPGWLEVSSGATAAVTYDSDGHVSPVEIARRQAFDLAEAGQPTEAGRVLLSSLRNLNSYERAWFTEEAAAYVHVTDPDRAQRLLRDARLSNIAVLRPVSSTPVAPLRPASEQAAQSTDYLGAQYGSAVELELGVSRLLDTIAFDESRVDEAEEGFRLLGLHLGFAAERPDRKYGTGPDVLWSVSGDTQLVIELKTGVTRTDGMISKSELDQVSGHLNWHGAHYPPGSRAVPVLIHPFTVTHTTGTPSPGLRVLTSHGLAEFKRAVRGWSTAVGTDRGWEDPALIRAALDTWGLLGRDALVRFTDAPTAGRD